MRSRVLVLATLAAAACSSRAPAPAESTLVTLGTFEGEMDADAGTLVVRSTSLPAGGVGPGAALVIPEGATGVTIANNGATIVEDGPGPGCPSVLSAPVRITLGASSPGLAGGLYAEILTLIGTGGEGCNSATAPSGLDATKGLWSYGTVRPGATTSDFTWKLRRVSGQKTTFTGRIVGVLGTTLAVTTDLPRAYGNANFRNPIIAYTRDQMTYASNAGKLVYVNLSGSYAGTSLSLPGGENANALAFHAGATAADDLLWFTTDSYVGVVHGGTVYSVAGGVGTASLASVVADPSTQNRAWYVSREAHDLRSVTFDPTGHGFTPGAFTIDTVNAAFSLAIGRATNDSNTWWLYATSDAGVAGGGDWIKTWTLLGGSPGTLANGGANRCGQPYGILRGPDEKLWFVSCQADQGNCGFCSYDPNAATYQRFSTLNGLTSGSAITFAQSVTAATAADPWVPWGIDIDFSGNPALSWLVQLVGADPTPKIRVQYVDTVWPTSVASFAGSPAVTVSGTAYPAYLWVTTGNGLLRLQP